MSRPQVRAETPPSPSVAAPPTWLERGRIPCLDGLRALAILLVLYAHGHSPGDRFPLVHMFKGRCGFLGVEIFFVLSGFLITTLMLREVQRTGRVHLGHFYLRRILRIVPVYAAYLLVLAILEAWGAVCFDGREWLAAATYTVNFLPRLPWAMSHLWSLCVEEHFYLLWPLFMALLPLRWCVRAIPACLGAAFLLRWCLPLVRPGTAIDLLTFTRIDDIAVGCGMACLAYDPRWRGLLNRFIASRRRLVLLVLLFTASQVFFSRTIISRLLPPLWMQFGIALANDINTLTIAVLMWTVLTHPSSFWGRLLNHPAAVHLGVLSYSVYLWHVLLCEKEELSWFCAFPQNLLFILLVAALSYRWIEKPFLAWKDRLAGEPVPCRANPPHDKRGPEDSRFRYAGASSPACSDV